MSRATATGRLLLVIAENLFRSDLSVIDRAVFVLFVQTFRDVWERKYGEINPKGVDPPETGST